MKTKQRYSSESELEDEASDSDLVSADRSEEKQSDGSEDEIGIMRNKRKPKS